MGGTYADALEVDNRVIHRFIAFADIEEDVKQKQNAKPKQQR